MPLLSAASQNSRSHYNSDLIQAALLALVVAACSSTRFPENPEEHRLYEELQAAGHEYYFNLRAGVSSRILGIMPLSEARNAADQIRERWADIDRIDDVDALAEYLAASALTEAADRIAEALLANQGDAPPAGIDPHLEAAAVKQGLVDAVLELETE